MKKVLTIMALALITLQVSAQERFLLAGASSNKIAIVNKSTQEIEWEYSKDAAICKECNSLVYTKGGDVAFAHKKGATYINSKGETIWEFIVNEGEELQCVSEIKGGYMLGIAGTPTRIVEVDKRGKIKKEVTFETGVENVHRQFRQIAKSSKGTYVVPVSQTKRMLEVDSTGKIIKDIKLAESSFYVSINKEGDWVATSGHAGTIYKVNGKSGEISTIVEGKKLDGDINLEFSAAIVQLKNGNYMLANWVGHNGDQNQPILIELDENGKVVWSMNKVPGFTFAAAVYPIY